VRRVRFDQRSGGHVMRYAVLIFLSVAALVGAVSIALDRNAQRSAWQEHSTALDGAARVSAASFTALRSDLRVRVSQLATSLPLQRAVLTDDADALRGFADRNRAKIDLGPRTIGKLPPTPRIVSTATINDGTNVLARVTLAIPLGDEVLKLLSETTPLPDNASLVLVRHGRVIAGGPEGASARISNGRIEFRGMPFAAKNASLRIADSSVMAVEPVDSVMASADAYRRYVILAALVTLAFAAAGARRLARPLAQAVGDVARLTRQAQTDALTGLANRRSFGDRLESELVRAAETGTSVSFVIGDIDGFKAVNDTYGHQAGDAIIKAVADALAGSVRELDLAGRYGGEEFVVVLPGSRLADAARRADAIRTRIAELEIPIPSGERLRVTLSFGVAEYPTYANADALVAAADAALYQAKRSGKNRVATATVQGEMPAPALAAAPDPTREAEAPAAPVASVV
jgi:diguanylate cyclase (GGDEF)-like protein